MRMFGWTDPTNPCDVALHMGFGLPHDDGSQEPCKIITLDEASMLTPNLDKLKLEESANEITRAEAFWETFRQIAEDPVGRVLLYRLLIEIRRQKDGKGCMDNPMPSSIRNGARSLFIKYSNTVEWGYAPAIKFEDQLYCSQISCFYGEESMQLTLVTNIKSKKPYTETGTESLNKRTLCGLFHEMLHWYQQLRDHSRVALEQLENFFSAREHPLALFYYGEESSPLLSWGLKGPFCLDELRVICGTAARNAGLNRSSLIHPRGDDLSKTYLEGDDLSENAFRLIKGLQMRFGHDCCIKAGHISEEVLQRASWIAHNCVRSICPNFFYVTRHPRIEWYGTKKFLKVQ